jgi:MFS family permease
MIRLSIALGFAQAGFHAWIATIPLAMHGVGRADGEIGAVVGAAAVFSLLAGLASGGLIDRYGGRAVYFAGCAALAAAAAPVAVGLVDGHSPFAVWLGVRLLQGIGLAATLPAIQVLVPGRVSAARLPTALASVGIAGNVSLALTPPLSLLLLDRLGLASVGLAVVVALVAGALSLGVGRLELPSTGALAHDGTPDRRRSTAFRPAWRPEWAAPLACTLLFVAHWGVVTGYLPQRADLAGADIGLFFTGDALALLALRIPAGWLAGRIPALPLVVSGVVLTCASLALLLVVPTTPLLIVAGIGTGLGSALFFPIVLIELSRRSDGRDRGSAFGLYSVAFGFGIAAGSIGLAPIFALVGFEPAMLAGIAACAAAGVIALFDRALRLSPTLNPARSAPLVESAGSPPGG